MEIEEEVEIEATCPKCGHKFLVYESVLVDIEPPEKDEL